MLNYAIFVFTIAGIYAVLAQSLVLSWGMGGIVNLGLAGFFEQQLLVSICLGLGGAKKLLNGAQGKLIFAYHFKQIVCGFKTELDS